MTRKRRQKTGKSLKHDMRKGGWDESKMKELVTVIFETIANTYHNPLYTWEDLFVKLNLLDDDVDFNPEDYGYKYVESDGYGEPYYRKTEND